MCNLNYFKRHIKRVSENLWGYANIFFYVYIYIFFFQVKLNKLFCFYTMWIVLLWNWSNRVKFITSLILTIFNDLTLLSANFDSNFLVGQKLFYVHFFFLVILSEKKFCYFHFDGQNECETTLKHEKRIKLPSNICAHIPYKCCPFLKQIVDGN